VTIRIHIAFMFATLIATSFLHAQTITQDELVHRTQELFDAVVPGNQAPFKEYFADDAMFFDEKGRSMDKAALVADVTPMDKGYSGSIKVVNPKSIITGNTAILSYDCNETETVFGQELHARYHETDTWLYRNNKWQIAAAQVLRYYEDPAPGKADPKKLAEFAGSYELAPGMTMTVFTDGQNLYLKRAESPKQMLIPETSDIFFRQGREGRLLFRRGDDGKVDAIINRRNNEDIVWKRIK